MIQRPKNPLALGAILIVLALAMTLSAGTAFASSHREAPGIAGMPELDATDFYMFRSYEPGREGYVTFVANYNPLQDPYGGPNYYTLSQNGMYVIHIDNDGDGIEDISFQLNPINFTKGIAIPVGGQNIAVPLRFVGPVGPLANQNVVQAYDIVAASGPTDSPLAYHAANFNGNPIAVTPNDNAGTKTFPNYDAYANRFMYNISFPDLPNCDGRVFVGQRKDSFVVNLGEIFDLVNTNPVGPRNGEADDLADKNVTSIILEVPIDCVKGNGNIIGAWTTSWLRRFQTINSNPDFDRVASESGEFVQVSRLGMPLVNEVVIGLPDKDRFNGSKPSNDTNFAKYVTNPTLPELLQILFGVQAPNNFPRTDLLAAFVTGVTGLNEFGFGEMQRLNLSIAPTAAASQSNLGVLGGDNAGFPNGRRPGDDVVDIELRVAMGVLCHAFPGVYCDPGDAPDGTLPYTDGALQDVSQFDNAFPYLRSPLPGSPN